MDNCCDCSTKELILVVFGLKAACSLIEQGKKRTGAKQMGSIYSEPAVLFKFAAFVCTPQKLPHVCSTVTKSCSWLQELLRDSNTSRFYFHLEVRKGQVLWMKRVLPPFFFCLKEEGREQAWIFTVWDLPAHFSWSLQCSFQLPLWNITGCCRLLPDGRHAPPVLTAFWRLAVVILHLRQASGQQKNLYTGLLVQRLIF